MFELSESYKAKLEKINAMKDEYNQKLKAKWDVLEKELVEYLNTPGCPNKLKLSWGYFLTTEDYIGTRKFEIRKTNPFISSYYLYLDDNDKKYILKNIDKLKAKWKKQGEKHLDKELKRWQVKLEQVEGI